MNQQPYPLCSMPKSGMTLVELMAASALATLLMGAMFGVLCSMSAERRVLFKERTIEPWREQLMEQLRWDISNARRMRSTTEELHLIGYGGCDFATNEATHRPTEIIYSIHHDGWRYSLFRKEIHLDSDSLHNSRVEMVATGVSAIVMERVEESEGDEPLDQLLETIRNRRVSQNTVSIPEKVRLVLFAEDEKKAVIDKNISLF